MGNSAKKMHDKSQWRQILGSAGWLAHTPECFREQLLAGCVLRRFARGELVYGLGDPPGGLWGLVAGGLAIEIAPAERGPYFGHFARPGAWFGEAAVITRMPRRVGLRATRASLLAFLSLQRFDAIAAEDPLVWRWLAILSVLHTDLAISVGDDLMIRDPRRRTIALLLRLAGCRQDEPGPTFEIDASQGDVAAMVNLSRTAFGLILNELEAEGLIEHSYRRISITDAAAMKVLVDR